MMAPCRMCGHATDTHTVPYSCDESLWSEELTVMLQEMEDLVGHPIPNSDPWAANLRSMIKEIRKGVEAILFVQHMRNG